MKDLSSSLRAACALFLLLLAFLPRAWAAEDRKSVV